MDIHLMTYEISTVKLTVLYSHFLDNCEQTNTSLATKIIYIPLHENFNWSTYLVICISFFISEYQQNLISCHSVENIIFYTALYFHDDTVILNCIHRFGSYIFTRHLPPHICHLSLRTQGSRG